MKTDNQFIINPIANIECKNSRYIISIPSNNNKKFEISPDLLSCLFYLHDKKININPEKYLVKKIGISHENAKTTFSQLIKCEILIKKQTFPSSYDLWIKNGWRNALIFHLATKNLCFADEHKQSSNEWKYKLTSHYLQQKKIPRFSKSIGNYIDLPPISTLMAPLGKVLKKRRTCRSFGSRPATLEQISTVLYYGSYDAKENRKIVKEKISDDSTALLCSTYTPFEIYFVSLNVADLESGIYHYHLEQHQISLIRSGQFNKEIRSVAIGQNVENCAAVFVITSCFERYMYRYRHSRSFRNIFIESGSLCQKLLLSAEAQNLRTFLTPALRDKLAEQLFDLESHSEYPLYLLGIGYGKTRNIDF